MRAIVPEYLFTARDRVGRSAPGRVSAATMEAARYALELRGYQEIVFFTDDTAAQFTERFADEMGLVDRSDPPPPAAQLAGQCGGGVASIVFATLRNSALLWLPFVTWTAWSLWQGPPYGWLDWMTFGLTTIAGLFVLLLLLPGVAYERLLHASVWNRAREVRFLVWFLGVLGLIGPARIPRMELDFRLAGALVLTGRRAEALRTITPYERAAPGDALVLGRLAGFWDAGGDHLKAHQLRAAAVEAGGGVTAIIDHACGLARYLRRPAEARESLQRVRDREISAPARIFILYTQGLIALEEGRHDEAGRLLVAAEAAAAPFRAKALIQGLLLEVRAHRALALAGGGRIAEARELFGTSAAFLVARRDVDLLARCQAALPNRSS